MKKLHILLAAAAFLAVAAGVGYAAIPSSSGTISACKDGRGGQPFLERAEAQLVRFSPVRREEE